MRAEHTEAVFNLQHLGFSVVVVEPEHLDAISGDAEGTALNDMNLVAGCCARVRELHWSCVCGRRADERIGGGQEGVLMLPPTGFVRRLRKLSRCFAFLVLFSTCFLSKKYTRL